MNEAPKTEPTKPLVLSDLMGSMERGEVHTVTLDVSPLLTWPDGSPLLLEWRQPSATDVYKIGNFAVFVRDDNPGFHWDLARDVATMAACHVSPPTGDTTARAFYAKIATTNETLWFNLLGKLGLEFPGLRPGIVEPQTVSQAPAQISDPTPPRPQRRAARKPEAE